MKITLYALILAVFFTLCTLPKSVISMFLRPYPTLDDQAHMQEVTNDLQTPGVIDRHHLHGILDKYIASGIFATYGGYLIASDYNGQLVFPRMQEQPIIHLLITTEATPNIITGNTIHHWQLEPGTPAAMYAMERQQDPDTLAYFWNVEKVDLPESNIVPLESILLFTKPKYVTVPTGITLTADNENFILPDVYIKKGIKILPSTLYVLNINQFFGRLPHMYQKRDASYTDMLAK